MKLKYHQTLNSERWRNFSFSQQILMIGSELLRAEKMILKNDYDEVKRCYERALELIYLTVVTTHRFHRLRELLRFKEALLDAYSMKPTLRVNRILFQTLMLMDGEAWNSVSMDIKLHSQNL